MGEPIPETFIEWLDYLVQQRMLVIEFKNYRMGEYTTHSFQANATSWAASGGPVRIIYDQDKADEEWRKAREQDEREAGGDE